MKLTIAVIEKSKETIKEHAVFSNNYILLEKDPNETFMSYDGGRYKTFVFGHIFFRKGGDVNHICDKIAAEFHKNKYGFLEEFDGNYLVIIYDQVAKTLIFTRDVLGLYHAYYSLLDGDLIISNSLTTIASLVSKKTSLQINPQSIDLYLTFQYLPSPHTMFNNIYQIPLRKIIKIESNKISMDNYKIKNRFSNANFNGQDTKIIAGEIKEMLIDSLRNQLPGSESKIAAFLSGGMDTSTNVALLVKELGIKPEVYTASFSEKEYDETYFANLISESFKLKHHVVRVGERDLVDNFDKITSLFDNPIADRAVFAEYIICKNISKNQFSALISGEGGDEVLGYPRNLAEQDIPKLNKLKSDRDIADRYYSLTSLVPEDVRRRLLKTNLLHKKQNYLLEIYKQMDNKQPFEKILFGQWSTWMIDNVLMKDLQILNDKSIKFVSPYMNRDLIDYVTSLTSKEKEFGLSEKRYLKMAMRNYLPPEILSRKKHRFHLPVNEWLRHDFYDFAYQNLLAHNSLILRYLNKSVVKKILLDHKSDKIDFNRPIWGMLFLESWYKNIISRTKFTKT